MLTYFNSLDKTTNFFKIDLFYNLDILQLIRSCLGNCCSVVWNGKDENGFGVASGIYLYRFQAGEYIDDKKMILIK